MPLNLKLRGLVAKINETSVDRAPSSFLFTFLTYPHSFETFLNAVQGLLCSTGHGGSATSESRPTTRVRGQSSELERCRGSIQLGCL